jgi:putative redox protein
VHRTTERVRFEGHAGNQLAGILELPSGHPVGSIVFSHCFTCGKDLKAIVRISRDLAGMGWIVLRFDFAGLGQSEGVFANTNFTTNQVDLRAAIHFLETHRGGPVFLMGHSFGGAVSLSLTQESNVIGTIGLAAPSDTQHLADLLSQMDPKIESHGQGTVTIGGRSFSVAKQMLDDFRKHSLMSTVSQIEKPLLILHSPTDETVPFWNAIQLCEFDSDRSTLRDRSLVNLFGANHLLTNHHSDCAYVAHVVDGWCRRAIEGKRDR